MIDISSGEDAMNYEPSRAHTFTTFARRQAKRLKDAKKEQSVNTIPALLTISHDGCGYYDELPFEACEFDCFDDVKGG